MRHRHLPDAHATHPNVTPLIDVVMCLIIFFMLVAKIGVSTGSAPLDLPPTAMGKKIDQIGCTIILNVKDPRPLMTDADPDNPSKERTKMVNGRAVRRNIAGVEDP